MNYDAIQKLAQDKIAQFGRDAVLKRYDEGTFNPATSVISGETVTSQTIKAVFTDYNERQIDGTIIKRGDRLVLIAGDIAEIKTNDAIDDYKVVNVEIVSPAGVNLIYKAQVRK